MASKTGKFHVYRDKAGEIRWTYYASNGRKIADSAEAYKRLGDAMRGVALMQGSAVATITMDMGAPAAEPQP